MKKILVILSIILSHSAFAQEGSWFAGGVGYENLASGFTSSGISLIGEGGYWYLGNMAYGGTFKAEFFGKANNVAGTNLKIFDLGGFWKAGNDDGLYGKLVAGVEFINLSGTAPGFKVGDGKSFYFGLGGGFLFPVRDRFQVGPEVIYRHLTARDGGDQVSIAALVAYSF